MNHLLHLADAVTDAVATGGPVAMILGTGLYFMSRYWQKDRQKLDEAQENLLKQAKDHGEKIEKLQKQQSEKIQQLQEQMLSMVVRVQRAVEALAGLEDVEDDELEEE